MYNENDVVKFAIVGDLLNGVKPKSLEYVKEYGIVHADFDKAIKELYDEGLVDNIKFSDHKNRSVYWLDKAVVTPKGQIYHDEMARKLGM